MFRDSEPIGVIAIYRREMRPFTDKHIGLVPELGPVVPLHRSTYLILSTPKVTSLLYLNGKKCLS
jgi:hypothetical protein